MSLQHVRKQAGRLPPSPSTLARQLQLLEAVVERVVRTKVNQAAVLGIRRRQVFCAYSVQGLSRCL